MFDFDALCARDSAPDRALRRRSHARRVRLWRGVADFAGSAGAGHRGPAQRDQYRRRRQCRAQYRLARRALHLRRPDRRGRGGREAEGRRWRRRSRDREPCWSRDPARPTTRKVRFVSEHFSTHMLRADWELAAPASAEIEQKLIDTILPQLAARRHRAAVRLCQGCADGARDPQRHRRRAQARQARHRRSQERQFRDLSRRDAADAEPQGICRGDPQPRRYRPRSPTPRRTRCILPIARRCW